MTDYLYHHGILGMKWGVRRFQNRDGTYTSAGRKRYAKGDSGSASVVKNRISHRDKLVNKYREKGMSQNEAEKAADKRIGFEKKVAIGAGVAVGALAVYGAYRYVSGSKLDANVDLDSQLKKKTFESSDVITQIDDDLRKVNRGGKFGQKLLRGRERNCTSCSMAYEMRRRGYDVVAGKREFSGRTNEEMLSYFQGDAKFEPIIIAEQIVTPDRQLRFVRPDKGRLDRAEQQLLKQGEGARGIINGRYLCGGGHSIAYEVRGNKVIFADGQIGRRYKDINEALGDMCVVNSLRTDNLALANGAAESVMNRDVASLLTERPTDTVVRVGTLTAVGTAYTAGTAWAVSQTLKNQPNKNKRRSADRRQS